jgi:hypothetical protein
MHKVKLGGLALAALVVASACSSSSNDANGGGGSSQVCTGLLPMGSTNCGSSAECCQTGPGVPVGGGCVDVGSGLCVPRCNTSSDCPSDSCCVSNASSFPSAGGAPTEPGGWCLGTSIVQSSGLSCLSDDANGYTCTGNGLSGYTCNPSSGGSAVTCAISSSSDNCEFKSFYGDTATLTPGQTAVVGQSCCGTCGCVDVELRFDGSECWQGFPDCCSGADASEYCNQWQAPHAPQ